MKKIAFSIMLLCGSYYYSTAQVGIGTTTPDASSILDVESSDKGVLIPRLTTVQRNAVTTPANGLVIYNSTTNRFEYNSGTTHAPNWVPLISNSVSADADNIINPGTDAGAYLGPTTYIGKFIISSTGHQTITGLPFRPTAIKFSAHANVESYNINADNGVGNNDRSLQNAFGSMQGYATNYGSIDQQVIYIGGSGNSINDISRYASSSQAIGIRYSNQNGDNLGLTAASVTSFNSDGFTINVSHRTENIVVIYQAYR
ncbi:hypothetical protein [Gelatiniphilus marinus]|uniref:Uncharacterized protein n=1 Tax=Gelatiniphilus marinus TaxID=1759464 RepID=A0ABW5JRP7_9FLAO